MKRRILSLLLCAALCMGLLPTAVFAEASGISMGASGLCEHHTEHTADCGYTEGTAGSPCNHEHTEDCCTLVTQCVHEHTAECYPQDSVSGNTATPSDTEEPTACIHECSEESGCITKELNCQHEHDEACGFAPATDGTPCTFVCGECNPVDSGELTQPEETVTAWTFIDEDGNLVDGVLALPGANEENPAQYEDIISLLPTQITATTTEGEMPLDLTWDCPNFPAKGAYSGEYIFTAMLPEGYVLDENAVALSVKVELGGGEIALYASSYTVEVAGIELTTTGEAVYATTDSSGMVTKVTDASIPTNNYVKFEVVNGVPTLTLKNATINSGGETGIYATGYDLTIYGEGSNSITATDSFANGIMIGTKGSLTLTGTLGDITGYTGIFAANDITISGEVGNITAKDNGIRTRGSLTVESGATVGDITVTSIGDAVGIWLQKDGNSTISGTVGNITVDGTDSAAGINANHSLTISGTVGNITATKTRNITTDFSYDAAGINLGGSSTLTVSSGAQLGAIEAKYSRNGASQALCYGINIDGAAGNIVIDDGATIHGLPNGVKTETKPTGPFKAKLVTIDDSIIYYTSLTDALTAENIDTITLLNNETLSENTTILEDMTLIIPENVTLTVSDGVTLTNNGVICLEGATSAEDIPMNLNGIVRLKDGSVYNLMDGQWVQDVTYTGLALYDMPADGTVYKAGSGTITATVDNTGTIPILTLTMKNATIAEGVGIYCIGADLILVGEGENNITAYNNHAVWVVGDDSIPGNLTIKGDFNSMTGAEGFGAAGNVTIEGNIGSVTGSNYGNGIRSLKKLTISGKVGSVAGVSSALYAKEGIELSNCGISSPAGGKIGTATDAAGGIYYTVLDSDGTTVAETVELVSLYTVNFNANGHGTAPEVQTIAYGGKVTKPDNPTADGWVFQDWYMEKECTTKYDFDNPVTEDITLYAKWEKKSTPVEPSDKVLYVVEHYKADKSVEGGYALAEIERFSGTIGDTVTANPKTYEGFTYNAEKSTASETLKKIENEADIVALKLYYDMTLYTVTVEGSYAETDGSGSHAEGETVTIDAGNRNGYRFDGWTVSDGVTLADASKASTTFTMPGKAVSVTANWKYISTGGGEGGNNSSNDNDNGSNNSGNSTIVDRPDKDDPNAPTTSQTKPVNPDKDGNATINNGTVKSAIQQAKQDAKKNGNNKNGIAVTVPVETKAGQTSIDVTLDKATLNTLVKEKVQRIDIVIDKMASFSLDCEVINQVEKIDRDIIIKVEKVSKIENAVKRAAEAKAAIGNRPVFDITFCYLENGKVKAISDLNGEKITVKIPYTLQKGEESGNLYAVYVDDSGKVQWITNSSYDPNQKAVLFETGHFSVYGVGYKKLSVDFTDIASHWAKDDIIFVANRGLLSGIGNNQFSPNTGVTRGMFVTALGRLAGINPTDYQTRKFTDVKADAYYAPYVNWAAEKGIVNGTSATTFAPDAPVTREQMAVIMAGYAKSLGYTLPVSHEAVTFADHAQISGWATASVKSMQQAAILSGKDGNRFDPQGTATRAEVSAILRRFVEIFIDPQTANGWTKNDNGSWIFYQDGKPVTGWLKDDGKWYWLENSGKMFAGGWKEIGGKWYYFNADGTMAVNTKVDRYEVGADGARK